jgi:hypothetical protein
MANMKATLMQRKRVALTSDLFAEIVIWQVPRPLRGSAHSYKYRMALVHQDRCVLRYDNEAGKGDHRHIGDVEVAYRFSTLRRLLDDFWDDAATYERGRR